jgi:hypothetical protein
MEVESNKVIKPFVLKHCTTVRFRNAKVLATNPEKFTWENLTRKNGKNEERRNGKRRNTLSQEVASLPNSTESEAINI